MAPKGIRVDGTVDRPVPPLATGTDLTDNVFDVVWRVTLSTCVRKLIELVFRNNARLGDVGLEKFARALVNSVLVVLENVDSVVYTRY